MKVAIASLRSIAPYSQSRYSGLKKPQKEDANEWEMKTWNERLHVNDEGYVFIPPMAFKKALERASVFLSMKIPGRKGSQTFSKHFKAGVLVMDGLVLPLKKEQVPGEVFFVSSNGKPGGPRVERKFPVIHEWSGDLTFYVIDDTITEEDFEAHLR